MSPDPDRLAQLRRLAAAEPEDALTRFLLGCEAAAHGAWAEAAAALEQAIRIDPGYSAAYRHLGNCQERQGLPRMAAETYRRGAEVARGRGDLQAAREMEAFRKRLLRDRRIESD